MTPHRLVLMVEGEGDVAAAPCLVRRLITESGRWEGFHLDSNVMRVGDYAYLAKREFENWRRFLKLAARRPNFAGCLLLIDGDHPAPDFCPVRAARELVAAARELGAAATFSLAVVFACLEFESWLIAGFDAYSPKAFEGTHIRLKPITDLPPDPERAPRDAKGWLRSSLAAGYKPTLDQELLVRHLNLDSLRTRKLRSFLRLEHAVASLAEALRVGKPIVSPAAEG